MIREIDEVAGRDGGEVEIITRGGGGHFGGRKTIKCEKRQREN